MHAVDPAAGPARARNFSAAGERSHRLEEHVMRTLAAAGVPLLIVLAGCGGSPSPAGPAPITAASPLPSPSPSPSTVILRRAALRGANGHSTSGSARIERDGGSHTLRLGEDFRIDSGNTDVYLARSPGRVDGGDLNLGELRMLTGAQSYAMPNDGGQYAHVVLWCRPFRVVIGLGDLQ
jgi:hypothetical protein